MILITRPKNESLLLAKELKAKKFSTYIEPLSSFQYYKKQISFNKKKIYIVSSLQAAHVLNIHRKNYKDIIDQGNFFVIGKKVYSTLKKIGVQNIIKHFKTSDLLLKYFLKLNRSDLDIIYLCGSVVNEDFIHALQQKKINFKKVILYKTIPVKQFSKRCLNLISTNQINVVLIYSFFAAKVFIRLLKKNNKIIALEQMYVLCLSKRIAQRFYEENVKQRVLYARSPDQQSMIKLLMDKKLKNY